MSVFDNRGDDLVANWKPYKILSSPFEGAIRVSRTGYYVATWVKSNRRNVKPCTCAVCKKSIAKGSQRLYRPLGNPDDRMNRICEACGDAAPPAP